MTIIDQWPDHVDTMKAVGLQMATREEDFRVQVQAYHLYEVCNLREQFDIVFLACKSYDSLWLTQLILPHLKSDGVLISAQNSINEEWVAPLVGPDRTMGCVITMSSEVFDPGHVKRNTAMDHTTFTLGELDGEITPRVQEIQQILSDAGKTEITSNLQGRRWAKLTFNATTAAVCALAGVVPATVYEAPERVRVCHRLGSEAVQVGKALGYTMEPVFGLSMEEAFESPQTLADNLMQSSSTEGLEARSFFYQDMLKGRRTEVDYINGLVSQKGKDVGVPTPANDAAIEFMKRLERGELQMDPANILELEAVIEAQSE